MLKRKTSKEPYLKQPVMIFSFSIQNIFCAMIIVIFYYLNTKRVHTVHFYLPISDKYIIDTKFLLVI